MKISSADSYFSKCVREANENTCEWCGKVGLMDCSHVFSRRHRSIRWDKLNANCLCKGCHRKWHESPANSMQWFESEFGIGRIEILREKMNAKIKIPKAEEKEIAKHYREQLKVIQQKREDGECGYIEFDSYQ